MPLVPAKCTMCGALLTIESSKEALVCQYCGNAFIVEKAINNYNTHNSVVNNIAADTVILSQEFEKEQLNTNAETYIKLGNLYQAKKCYQQLVNKFPDDYRGWWGLAYYEAWDNLSVDNLCSKLSQTLTFLEKLAPPEKYDEFKTIINKRLEEYRAKLNEERESNILRVKNIINDLIESDLQHYNNASSERLVAQQKYNTICSELTVASEKRESAEKKWNRYKKQEHIAEIFEEIHVLAIIGWAIIAIIGIIVGAGFFTSLIVCLVGGALTWIVMWLIGRIIGFILKIPKSTLQNNFSAAAREEEALNHKKQLLQEKLNKYDSELDSYEKMIAYQKTHSDDIVEAMLEKGQLDSYSVYSYVQKRVGYYPR